MELYATDPIPMPSYDELFSDMAPDLINQGQMVSPIINGIIRGLFQVGSSNPQSTAGLYLNGDLQRLVINDGSNDRILLGDDGT